MVHNCPHHAFFLTYSLTRNVHPDEYEELKKYICTFGKWFVLKAEDVLGEGKVHLHAIHIRDFAEFEEHPSRFVTMYGPRRCADTVGHIVQNCPNIAKGIATSGGRHSLQAVPLTSSQYIEYLNKETPIIVNNLPEDFSVIQPYLSECKPKPADPEMVADAKKYTECVDQPWYKEKADAQSCRRFYRYYCNVLKQKRTIKDPKTLARKAETLAAFMNESVYSDDEDRVPAGECLHCGRKTPSYLHGLCSRCS